MQLQLFKKPNVFLYLCDFVPNKIVHVPVMCVYVPVKCVYVPETLYPTHIFLAEYHIVSVRSVHVLRNMNFLLTLNDTLLE